MERRLTRAEFNFVEQKLFNYLTNKQIADDYNAQKNTLPYGTGRGDGQPRGSGVGRPTEVTALQLTLLEHKVKCEAFWIRAIDDTLTLLSPEERRLVQLKYFEGYLTNEGIMLKMGMGKNRFNRMRGEIITKFARRMTLL